jgi:hypothetical protein
MIPRRSSELQTRHEEQDRVRMELCKLPPGTVPESSIRS